MVWTFETVMEKLGDTAQPTAGGIIVLQRFDDETRPAKHIKIGYFVGLAFVLTEEGREYLEPNVEDAVIVSEAKRPKAKRAPVKQEVVEEEIDLGFDE